MDARTARSLTPARIVAIVLVSLMVLGLAYVRIGRGFDSVSRPEGATAGDLSLERCDYATEGGDVAADCGTLVVPENRADPKSRLIALPVVRIRAESARPAEPIFLAAVSLLAMAHRVHTRGGLGRKTAAAIRSMYTAVLGLGGWCLGVLVVTMTPGVPLDDEFLASVSVGLPIGLGVWLAWVNRDWSTKINTTGFAAAVGAALVGAWLGFNATEGLVALVTTIAGAAAGANLILLVFDIAWDREGRDRFAQPTSKRPHTPTP